MWAWKKAKRAGWNLIFLMIAVSLVSCSGGMRSSLASVSSSVAGISAVAGSVAEAGANITVAATGIAVGAVVLASSALEEAMRGIDLVDLDMDRYAAKMVGKFPEELAKWFRAGAVGNLPAEHLPWFANTAGNLTVSVPFVSTARDYFSVRGKFNKLWVRCRLRADGTAAAAALVVNMSFKAEWINPAWDLAGFRVDTQSERIAARLRSIVAALPPVDGNLMALDDASLKAELGAALSWKAMLPPKSMVAGFLLVGAPRFRARRRPRSSRSARTGLLDARI